MKETIKIEYPEYLANTLRLSGKDFELEMKTISLIKLYELGKVSSGVAARVLGLQRLDFLELLGNYKVSTLGVNDTDSLTEEIENA